MNAHLDLVTFKHIITHIKDRARSLKMLCWGMCEGNATGQFTSAGSVHLPTAFPLTVHNNNSLPLHMYCSYRGTQHVSRDAENIW